jgi:hypothetical protein
MSRLRGVTIDGEWIYWPLVYTTRNCILQIIDTYRLMSFVYYKFHNRFLATASTDGGSSASCTQVFLSQPPVQKSLSTVNSNNGMPGWGSFHSNHLVFSGWLSTEPSVNWTLSHTNQLLHIASLNWTARNSNSGTLLTLLITFRHESRRKHNCHCYSPTVPRP